MTPALDVDFGGNTADRPKPGVPSHIAGWRSFGAIALKLRSRHAIRHGVWLVAMRPSYANENRHLSGQPPVASWQL